MASIISTKTSGGGGIAVTGDTSGVLELASANGTTAVTINASQNVGIGTASPTNKVTISTSGLSNHLTLTGSQQNGMQFQSATGGAGYIVGRSLFSDNANDFFVYDLSANVNRLRVDSSGNFQFNSGYGSAATAYGCRAWVSFNGSGGVSINSSGNISSVTRGSTGNYTVIFANAMPDNKYSALVAMQPTVSNAGSDTFSINPTTTQVEVRHFEANVNRDSTYVSVAVFR
jgi:hypothetical protein